MNTLLVDLERLAAHLRSISPEASALVQELWEEYADDGHLCWVDDSTCAECGGGVGNAGDHAGASNLCRNSGRRYGTVSGD
jgi:hypothetical protein